MKKVIQSLLSKIGWHTGKYQREEFNRIGEDIESILHLPDLGVNYIPWTTAALRPAGVRALLNEVVIHGRRSILEFGAGVSTLYISKYIKNNKISGRVISVEEDEEWASIVKEYLRKMDISSQYCRVVEAPLEKYSNRRIPELWYDSEIINGKIKGKKFDMIFVDGPVSWSDERKMARLPALPYVIDYLRDDFVVFLDDAEWGDQREILRRWVDDYDLEAELVAGMGVLRPSSTESFYDIL